MHPETGLAWERWHDRPVIEHGLRKAERDLELREVPGRLASVPGHERADGRRLRAPNEVGTSEEQLTRRVRSTLPELRAAKSWDDLADRFAQQGMTLERKRHGLLITDGANELQASRVARELSLRRLEARFGVPFQDRTDGRRSEQQPTRPAALSLDAIAQGLRAYEDAARTRRQQDGADHTTSGRAWLTYLAQHEQHARAASAAFDRALAAVYRDSQAAREAFERSAATKGLDHARKLMETEPNRFGALRRSERRALRAWSRADDGAAREWASAAAAHGAEAVRTEKRLGAVLDEQVRRSSQAFEAALGAVYRDPATARQRFEHRVKSDGVQRAVERLTEHPTEFGTLKAGLHPKSRAVRDHLAEAAVRAGEVAAMRSVSANRALERADRLVEHARSPESRTHDARAARPKAPEHVARTLGLTLSRLAPPEVQRLKTLVTAPQFALAQRLRASVRDALLGRDEQER